MGTDIFLQASTVKYFTLAHPNNSKKRVYLDEPLLSVMLLSTRIVYGNLSSEGRTGPRALSASVP